MQKDRLHCRVNYNCMLIRASMFVVGLPCVQTAWCSRECVRAPAETPSRTVVTYGWRSLRAHGCMGVEASRLRGVGMWWGGAMQMRRLSLATSRTNGQWDGTGHSTHGARGSTAQTQHGTARHGHRMGRGAMDTARHGHSTARHGTARRGRLRSRVTRAHAPE